MILQHLKVRSKLILMMVIVALGLIISGFVSYLLIQKIRIGGTYYNELLQSKDLVADILPPPIFIIESYLLAFQEASEKNPIERDHLIQKSKSLQKQYYEVHAKWVDLLPDNYLKELITKKSNEFVIDFFSIWEHQFVPALMDGNLDEANKILMGPLTQKFNSHQEVIDEVVGLASESYQKLTAESKEYYASTRVTAWGSWGLTLILSAWLTWIILDSLIKRLQSITSGLESISTQINATANKQTLSTDQQSTSIRKTTATLDGLNDSFKTTQALAKESINRASHAFQMSKEGNIQLKQMVEQLSKHREKVSQILDQILRLGQLTRQIHNIASLTSNLTNQTNILALNAAVQAAHVKQYGEGFSVIAGEIRKLGDESKKFLNHIDTLSESIEQATDETIRIVEEGNQTVQELIQLAHSTTRSFDSIMMQTNHSVEGAEKTSSNITQQGISVHNLLETMEELNKVSQDNLTGMQKIRTEISKLDDLSQQLKSDI